MSFYGKNITVDGLVCGVLMRGAENGEYALVFEREHASLEQIEAVNWARPEVWCRREADRILPAGCGFRVQRITYDSGLRAYTVTIRVMEQYLGDVTGYQAQVSELAGQVQAAQARDAALEAAYKEGVEGNG